MIARPLALAPGPDRVGDVRDSQADHRRLRTLFPAVEPIALRDGLRATVDWFRDTQALATSAPT